MLNHVVVFTLFAVLGCVLWFSELIGAAAGLVRVMFVVLFALFIGLLAVYRRESR